MNTENQKSNLIEPGDLSADEQKISRLIGRLDRVSAPKDFDFRLKARIAARENGGAQASGWRALRYALPLTATVVIAAFLMVQAGLFSPASEHPGDIAIAENQTRPAVAEPVTVPANREVARATNEAPATDQAEEAVPGLQAEKAGSVSNLTASRNPVQRQVKLEPTPLRTEDPIRSKDFTVRPSNVQIMPEGINPRQTLPENKGLKTNDPVSAQEVLQILGVEIEEAGSKLKVRSVSENSLAGRSGVKRGDVIESIDEQKIDRENLSPQISGAKTITVTRDGRALKIELKPN